MFVLQKLGKDLDAKEREWSRKAKAWAEENSYRSVSSYADSHPSPKQKIRSMIKSFIFGLLLTALFLLIFGFIQEYNSPERVAEREAESIVESDNDCRKFNKGDYVVIQYGDYANLSGRVHGGCNNNEMYQIKLEDGAEVDLPNDGIHKPIDVGGDILPVRSGDNLVKVEEPKENKSE